MSGKILKVLHKFAISVCAAQLTLYTSPLMAQPVSGSGNIINEDVSTASQIGMAALDIVNMGAKTYLQARQQSFAALQQTSLYQQLAPRTQFDKFFGCPIPESDSAFIQNACQYPNPAEIDVYKSLQSIADGYEDYYNRLSNPIQNSRTPIGLQCLEVAKSRNLNGMQQKLKDLQELRALLKKSQQQFRDDQEKLLADMDDINGELKGRKGTKSGDNTDTFRNEIGDDCSNILGNMNLNVATAHEKGGFIGMLSKLETPNLDAANFTRDKNKVQRDVNDLINQIKADIARDGIDNWGGSPKSGNARGVYFQKLMRGKHNVGTVIQQVLVSEETVLTNKLSQYENEIKDADPTFKLPNRDKNFHVNMEKFIAGAESHYKREAVRKCISGEDRTGVGLNTNQILNSLYLPTSRKRDTQTLRDYKSALQGILNDKNITIEQQEEDIAALDRKYGNSVKMRFANNQSVNQENVTALDYYKNYISDCEAQFEQDDTFGPGGKAGAGNDSKSTKVKRAVRALRDMKNEIDRFAENIGAQIDDQLNNCNGAKLSSSGPNSCGPDMIKVDSPNFCIPHATTCSQKINACYKKVNDGVKRRQDELNNKAIAYNDRMENYVTNQEQILQQIRGVVSAQEDFLTQFFESDMPESNIEDLFIGMPAIKEHPTFGVDLRGGGSLEVMQEMDKKLTLVQGQIKNQKKILERRIDKHISDVTEQLVQNKNKWSEIKNRCKNIEDAIRSATDNSNTEGAKAQAETDQKVGTFCSRFDRLSQVNPGPGCDGDNSPENLFGDMHDVSAHLDPRVKRYLFAYQNVCASVNNEADSDDSSGNNNTAPLLQACQRSGNNWDRAYSNVAKEYLEKMDRAGFDDKDYKAIKEYLSDGGDFPDSLSDDFNESEFADIAMQIGSMREPDMNTPMSEVEKYASERRKSFDDAYNSMKNNLIAGKDMFPGSPAELQAAHSPSGTTAFDFNGTKIDSMDDIASLIANRSKLTAEGVSKNDLNGLYQNSLGLMGKRETQLKEIQVKLLIPGAGNLTDPADKDKINKYIKGELAALPEGAKIAPFTAAQLLASKNKFAKTNNAILGLAKMKEAIGGNKLANLDPQDGRAPEATPRSVASGENLCDKLDSEIVELSDKITDSCSKSSDTSECEDKKTKNLERKLAGVSRPLRNLNNSLNDLEAVAFDDSAEQWRNIGEQAQGICKARSTASRNGLINQDALQQLIGGPQNPQRRNSFGVQ